MVASIKKKKKENYFFNYFIVNVICIYLENYVLHNTSIRSGCCSTLNFTGQINLDKAGQAQ